MENLKYCPFCGSNNAKILLEHDKDVGRCWYVECQKCYSKGAAYVECPSGHQDNDEALGQIKTAVKNAAAAWNRRADDGTDKS